MKDLFSDFKKNHNVVFLCRKENPLKFTFDLLGSVSKKSTRVLYITVDKSYSILTEKLRRENINFSNWFFIDCLSSSILAAEMPSSQCEYLSSPRALVDLAMAIDGKIGKYDLIVFDNISSLLYYNDYVSVLQLLNSLMARVRKSKNHAAYLLSYDAKKEVMEDLALFADKVEIL